MLKGTHLIHEKHSLLRFSDCRFGSRGANQLSRSLPPLLEELNIASKWEGGGDAIVDHLGEDRIQMTYITIGNSICDDGVITFSESLPSTLKRLGFMSMTK